MKYSIILPYYNRLTQLKETLSSFVQFYFTRNDCEIIIVEDGKQTEEMNKALKDTLQEYRKVLKIVHITLMNKNHFNPSFAYNQGAKAAKGDFFVLSNPECRHELDILSEADKEFNQDKYKYIICSCKSLKEDGSFHMWYHHSIHRNTQYHFCSIIPKSQYFLIDGFDERYSMGYGYEDNAFRDKVKESGISFVNRDDLLVTHLWHEKVRPMNYKVLLERNRSLYEKRA